MWTFLFYASVILLHKYLFPLIYLTVGVTKGHFWSQISSKHITEPIKYMDQPQTIDPPDSINGVVDRGQHRHADGCTDCFLTPVNHAIH